MLEGGAEENIHPRQPNKVSNKKIYNLLNKVSLLLDTIKTLRMCIIYFVCLFVYSRGEMVYNYGRREERTRCIYSVAHLACRIRMIFKRDFLATYIISRAAAAASESFHFVCVCVCLGALWRPCIQQVWALGDTTVKVP